MAPRKPQTSDAPDTGPPVLDPSRKVVLEVFAVDLEAVTSVLTQSMISLRPTDPAERLLQLRVNRAIDAFDIARGVEVVRL